MADKVVVHVDEVRQFISQMTGVAKIADLLPAFLRGRNMEYRSIWLSKEDLGGWEPFHDTWTQLCDARDDEAKEMAKYLSGDGTNSVPGIAAMLVKALEKYTGEDERIAATFPGAAGSETLDDLADKYGINYESPHERRSRNVPE